MRRYQSTWVRWFLAAAIAAGAGWASAQLAPGTRVRGFRIPGYDAANGTNSMVIGAEALPQANGDVLVKGLRVETYREDGAIDMVVEAPECTFDHKRRVVYSAGALSARALDDRFSIAGEGFTWVQTNANLTISNRVHTVIRKAPQP